MLVGVFLAVLSQCSDFVDDFAFADASPLTRAHYWLHETLEHALLVGGVFALICGSLLAILEGEVTARRLRLERERLAGLGRERLRAESGFQKARGELERMVEARTAELSARNEELRARLAEHEEAKEALGARLRVEKGLAACSHALLTESEPLGGGVGKALAVCREAWACDRVVLCENRTLDDGTLVLGVVFVISSDVSEHWAVAYPQHVEPYAGGLERWRAEFEAGRIVSGPVALLPARERARLASYDIVSLLAVPLRWHDAWRGCVILIDAHAPREWPEEDVVLLFTLAGMLGAHYEITSVDEKLRDAYDALERRVAQRTQSLTEANRKLTEEVAFRKRAEEDNARLESRLRSAQKFEAIATLAGGIAHDFNNILSAIIGFSELGLHRTEDQPNLRRHFQEILNSGRRATELVRRLLVFSRQAEHQAVPVSPTDLVAEVAGHLRRVLPGGVTLRERSKPGVPLVLADPDRMREALMMLGENALDAVKSDGSAIEMIVDTAELQRDLHTPHGVLGPGLYVRITVQDDGPGMDPGTLDRVFEPFFTTKGVGEGSGMGLATVHGVIARHSGAIRVESKPGRGAAFRIFLPAYDGRRFQGAAPGLRLGGGTEHILVVDDEAHLVSLWAETLERYGYRTSAFSSSLEARDAFAAAPDSFDMVLTDNMMPKLTGLDFARMVLSLRPGIPVVMATGFSDSVDQDVVKSVGIHTLILKPLVGSELAAVVRKALDEVKAPAAKDQA